ncbi:aldo/keto reductase [Candidatus Gottesmanbacteria bacterium CG11_big_fil_rev_8_21_14_0_20_37_11]|uniref:Aldo/keto reductase n=2 Tax=Candidatus Gottesmaniibacteriota TaxID=1752720 RepID=A0A2M7RPL1_9BACT|nr:MAG: aldo/keto reductase [Candidatus Gottesmanbacteria bacterium CG11_big_fil_rev_8_21_14_0_20_37_11]PIZ02212.1 MAG: aldo/keto reductase [Candidatus Gottesmanbacteria bacterium CG_4_10_14_0_8_um_filter_37_24]
MQKKYLKNGFSIPLLGFGTWLMCGDKVRNMKNDDRIDIKSIQTAIDNGVTHIDTSEYYAQGHVEKIIGEAIKNYNRKRLFITSKAIPINLGYKNLIKSAHSSLKRLNTDYFDLYLIHSPNLFIPIKETMKAMDHLINNGFTRSIGVCNFTVSRLETAQNYAQNKIVVNQVNYNLIIREIERKNILGYCQNNDIMIIAWAPLQKGILAKNNSSVMKKICKKYEKTPAQIALNWLISQKNVVTISKMRNKKNLIENLGTLGWKMENSDIEYLRSNFPNVKYLSDTIPLEYDKFLKSYISNWVKSKNNSGHE